MYDSFLQAALRQFFARATFETEPMLSASSDGRLAIEPTDDPCVMYVRWFGTRYGLRVPERRPFTPHEIRMAKAIGSVLAARYHAILNPKAMIERGELFRGAIEDRYAGVFADGHAVSGRRRQLARRPHRRGHRSAARGGAVELREPRDLVGRADPRPDGDARAAARTPQPTPLEYSQSLTGVKSFFRLVDGQRTLFLATHEGRLLDIVDVRQWSSVRCGEDTLPAPVPSTYEAHARATVRGGHVCVVLSPSHEIKVFAEGAEILTFRHAHWHLLDVQAKFELWAEAVGQRSLATRLFQTALELSNARQGALFVVLRDPVGRGAASGVGGRPRGHRVDRRRAPAGAPADTPRPAGPAHGPRDHRPRAERAGRARQPRRRDRDRLQRQPDRGRRDPALGVGRSSTDDVIVEGARTTAAMTASRFGPVLKVSEDGAMTFYDGVRVWDL